MADPAGPNRAGAHNEDSPLKYAFDAGFLSGEHPPDTPNTIDPDDGTSTLQHSDSQSSDSDTESTRSPDLAKSLRVFSESMLRMELVELEMIKAREASRLEAEKRRAELEIELTRITSQTQLQIASFLSRKSTKGKRKRSNEDGVSNSVRDGAVLMSLLQFNLI